MGQVMCGCARNRNDNDDDFGGTELHVMNSPANDVTHNGDGQLRIGRGGAADDQTEEVALMTQPTRTVAPVVAPRAAIVESLESELFDIETDRDVVNKTKLGAANAPFPELHSSLDVKVVREVSGDGGVGCLTVLNECVYVIRSSQPRVFVYDKNTMDFVRRIRVDGLSEQQLGMTSSPALNCLFISDYLNGSIHRVDLKNETFTSDRSVGTHSRPIGLSMTGDGRLLVTCGGLNCLKLYSSAVAMELVETIPLKHANPEYAVELAGRKQFAVSHKEPEKKVFIISSVDGTIAAQLSAFMSSPGGSIGKLDQPRGLVAIGMHHILVADLHRNCIVLFDLRKKTGDVVVTGDVVANPQTLSWDGLDGADRGRLYVGEFRHEGYVRVIESVVSNRLLMTS